MFALKSVFYFRKEFSDLVYVFFPLLHVSILDVPLTKQCISYSMLVVIFSVSCDNKLACISHTCSTRSFARQTNRR